jgi:uncharacterized protein YdeI (YjbR/CyaY-like superfamily)
MSAAKVDRDDLQAVWAATPAEWRAWLEKHHDNQPGVWLHYHKKASGKPSIVWSEAVDEALCFGWIDSLIRPIDDLTYRQYFAPRKATGTWSAVNKAKIERLIAEGRMTAAGLAAIDRAKANGSWEAIDSVEAMTLPAELETALGANPQARAWFDGLSKTPRWSMLHWINAAKRPQTRQERIDEVVRCAAEERLPDRFRQRRSARSDAGPV